MANAYAYIELDLNEFDDLDLVYELQGRGWFVGPEKDWEPNEGLTDDENEYIVSMLTDAVPGSFAHGIYEKLRKK